MDQIIVKYYNDKVIAYELSELVQRYIYFPYQSPHTAYSIMGGIGASVISLSHDDYQTSQINSIFGRAVLSLIGYKVKEQLLIQKLAGI